METQKFIEKYKGLYEFKSPYHKNKKLPFSIVGNSWNENFPILCNTVGYRGWKKEEISSEYKVESLLEMINTGFIKRKN